MAWTYSGDPASSPKDEQRFLIGDTDPGEPILQDAEILYVIGLNTSASRFAIAAKLCEAAEAFYAKQVDKKTDNVSLFASQQRDHYRDLAARMRSRIVALPYAGGISKQSKQTYRDNPDNNMPYVAKDDEFSPAAQAPAVTKTRQPYGVAYDTN